MAHQAIAKLETVSNAAKLAVMLDPLRRRILESLRKPNSSSGLAKQLKLPRQRINYHLRELEKCRLVEFVEERRKGNCNERIVRASAARYVIDSHALGSLAGDPDRIEDRFSTTYQVAVAAKAIADLTVLERRANLAKKKLPTITLQIAVRFSSQEQQQEFASELSNAIATLAAKYHNESAGQGRLFQFYLGGYPAITKSEDHAAQEAKIAE